VFIRRLRIQRLKLLRDLDLSFVDADGKPRMWTVLIGENGTGKTSILQAIAMAAAGRLQVNTLAEQIVPHLRDRRQPHGAAIESRFGLFKESGQATRQYPFADDSAAEEVLSQVRLEPGATTLEGESCYVRPGEIPPLGTVWTNPLDEVRSTSDLIGCAGSAGREVQEIADTRAGTAVWVRCSSVDHRIMNVGRRHLHDPPAIHRPAVQFISHRDPDCGAALRVVASEDGIATGAAGLRSTINDFDRLAG